MAWIRPIACGLRSTCAGARRLYDRVDEVPEQLRIRTLAVRAFDADAMMLGWDLVDGCHLIAAMDRLFANPQAAYLHIHYAAPGCYAALVQRV